MANLSYKHFTLGVEEEYMVIDPETRELKSHDQKIVHEGQKVIKDKVKAEMHQAVVEVGTDICQDIEITHNGAQARILLFVGDRVHKSTDRLMIFACST
jgi:carboxylate-amine ligase